jgi:hemerythrin-like domain-containing protein
MNSQPAEVSFEAMDECHRQIHTHLASLAALARQIGDDAAHEATSTQAAAIEAFFSGTSRRHHADEEQTVFPSLLASADAELVAAVRSLQQDHGWIEENWIALAPQLRAIAQGHHWVDPAEFQHAAQVFVELCEGHIALEESLVYPEAKARWAQALARRGRPQAAVG